MYSPGRVLATHHVGAAALVHAKQALTLHASPVDRFAVRRADGGVLQPLADEHRDEISALARLVQETPWKPPQPVSRTGLLRLFAKAPAPAPQIPEPELTLMKLASILVPCEVPFEQRDFGRTDVIAASLRLGPESIRWETAHNYIPPTPGHVLATFPLFAVDDPMAGLIPITREELTTLPKSAAVTRMYATIEEVIGVMVAVARECGLDAYMVNMTFGARFQTYAPGIAVLDPAQELITTVSLDSVGAGGFGHPSVSRLALYDDHALRGMLEVSLAYNIIRRIEATVVAVTNDEGVPFPQGELDQVDSDLEALVRKEFDRAIALLFKAREAIGEVTTPLGTVVDGIVQVATRIDETFGAEVREKIDAETFVFDPNE